MMIAVGLGFISLVLTYIAIDVTVEAIRRRRAK